MTERGDDTYGGSLEQMDAVIARIRECDDLDALPGLVAEGRRRLDACKDRLDAVTRQVNTELERGDAATTTMRAGHA